MKTHEFRFKLLSMSGYIKFKDAINSQTGDKLEQGKNTRETPQLKRRLKLCIRDHIGYVIKFVIVLLAISVFIAGLILLAAGCHCVDAHKNNDLKVLNSCPDATGSLFVLIAGITIVFLYLVFGCCAYIYCALQDYD